ncbi:prepilin-type N-terminal cleavage/methylation domain-containing protein [Pelagicoccus sp. NFK12]|uniref:Prepilin-type N-terminal cleavage/methylation domain-containing protein n=2 Tax=Pelagicoccus enzymogenes TaxID=2773457 RepID=A0A927F7C7_9BACT|nr:prepilin-type N-terminal cleavage/methylation domain-containing protein [Pelagicoccus enzymogenes]
MRRGPSSSPISKRTVRAKAAFTLFELLVTMAVISVLAGIGFYSIARGTEDRALEKGADILHSMVRVARTQAITNGVHSRLIINADPNDPESYLRRIGVVIEDPESGYVKAVDRGALLPEGIYLVPQGEGVQFPSGWPETGRRSVYRKANGDTTDDTAVYAFDYPLKDRIPENTAGKPDWICIQFAPNGRLSTVNWGGGGGLVPLSNQLVLANGRMVSGNLSVTNVNDYIGIAFKRNGSSYQTREADLVDDQ